jgi:hypothetical protein
VKWWTLALLLTAMPTQAEITAEDLLLAARCIGAEEAWLDGQKHIKPDPEQAEKLAFAFSEIAGLPMSPPRVAMEAARKQGRQQEAEVLPDAFGSVEEIMTMVDASAACVEVIDRLGLLPVVYPVCFPDGCPD